MTKKKDYCSLWPDRSDDGKDWGSCCEQHDECYSAGGDAASRKKCDKALKKCLKKKAGPVMAWIMYAGVRSFGWLPHHFKRDLFFRKRK